MKKKHSTEKELLQEICTKLDKLIGISAIQGKEEDDQIKILVSLGYTNSEISRLAHIPKGTVDTKRAKHKKRKGR